LDGEQFGRFSLFARACRKGLQRLTVAIDTGDPDARRQQAARQRPANATRRTGHDRYSLGLPRRGDRTLADTDRVSSIKSIATTSPGLAPPRRSARLSTQGMTSQACVMV
jgi:hypothetical protein